MRREKTWWAGVVMFSGRPDPTWQLTPTVARQFEALWDALNPLLGTAPIAAPLGYRGCFASDGAGRHWAIFGGAVTLTEQGASEARRDPDRALERFIIESAPIGQLPQRINDVAGLDPAS